jgi:hypothetical protein
VTETELGQALAAQNQSLFRTVNDQIASLNERFAPVTENGTFVCECEDASCVERIEMKLTDYQRIRKNPRWFFVASEAHAPREVERLVEASATYCIVENIGAAARVAEQAASE